MLIGIDGNEANVTHRVGSNIYAFELLCQFYRQQSAKLRIPDDYSKTKFKFLIYLKDNPLADLPERTSWWEYKVVKPGFLWTQWRLPLELFLGKPGPDVFFTPGHYAPRYSPCPTAMAIMDLSYIYFPKMFKKKDLWQLQTWTARSVKKTRKILTISQFSKNAIIEYYHVDSDRVIVTYPGFKMNHFVIQNQILKKYGLVNDYLLYVGTLQPRKNLPKLIEAFDLLKSSYPHLSLVIVGKKGWLYEEIFTKVKALGLGKKVIFTGYVPDEELPAFYQNARCFCLPSLYEGFGIPALEAMAYGCPVVVSNVSSLPEIVADAGILVDPQSIPDIAQGIEKILKMDSVNRQNLIQKGQERVKQFSWEKCAKETLQVLENLGKNNHV